MRQVAERLGHTILERETDIPVRGLATRNAAGSHIVLVASGYLARDEFTIAHELMELHIPRDWRTYLPNDLKEGMCDRGAAALLLPTAPFRASVDELAGELPALRRHWRNASWDVIARRLVDVGLASTAAAWDSLELSWRYGGAGHSSEEEALGHVYSGRGAAQVGGVRAWRLGGAGLGRAVSVGTVI